MTKIALFLLFQSVSADLGLPYKLLEALCFVESNHRTDVINYADGHGDSLGVCQIKLNTAKLVGFSGDKKDLMEPDNNVWYAGLYLKKQLVRYNGDVLKAVAAYNSGKYIEIDGSPVNSNYTNKVLLKWSKYLKMAIPLKQFSVSIRGQRWIVKQYTDEDFDHISKGDLAVTVYAHTKQNPVREMWFSEQGSTRNTVAHEILHAYLSYEPLKKRKNTKNIEEKVEEDICEAFGRHHDRMHKLIDEIFNKLAE